MVTGVPCCTMSVGPGYWALLPAFWLAYSHIRNRSPSDVTTYPVFATRLKLLPVMPWTFACDGDAHIRRQAKSSSGADTENALLRDVVFISSLLVN
jgi:hypothetical protein